MTVQTFNAYVAQYNDEVHQKFQGKSVLFGSVRTSNNVVGLTERFTTYGVMTSTERILYSPVVPDNVDVTTATATIKNYILTQFTETFDIQKINYDERAELVRAMSSSMGRRYDQAIVDALIASGTTNTVASALGANAALNMAKIRRASKLLDDQGVEGADRHLIVSPTGLEQLLGDEKATSADYTAVKALINGDIGSYMSFNFHKMENRPNEGGLPKTGDIRTLFAYHKRSTGLAVGQQQQITMTKEELYNSWLTKATLALGGVAIDNAGIVKIDIDESVVVN